MNVDDKVYTVTSGHWGHRDRYRAGVVTKITPTGLIDVTPINFASATRFNKDLRQLGDRYNGERIDTEMSFTDRTVWLANIRCIDAAGIALSSVTPSKDNRRYDTREELEAEAFRLQSLISKARELIRLVSKTEETLGTSNSH